METTVAVGLGLGVLGLGLRLVKVPEHFGWGLVAAGVIIVAWGLAPGLKPSGWQLALYLIGVAAIASAASWQVSDVLAATKEKAATDTTPLVGDLPIEVVPRPPPRTRGQAETSLAGG